MLSAHYRSPLNFSADLMEAAKNGLDRIVTGMVRLAELEAKAAEKELSAEETEGLQTLQGFVTKFEEAMDDDFNTADAISAVFEIIRFANSKVTEDSSKAYVQQVRSSIQKLCDVLGIITEKKEESLDDEVEALIEQRQAARKAKDFAKADEIRDKLLAMGIVLKDTREGVKWERA